MIEPLVSIVTPSFNQAAFLEETILSVLNQTYKKIEYIIIDGGSTDNSLEIIKKHENKIDYWVSEKDNGQADAINKGFRQAKGEFLCWVNSDDILYPNFIERRIKEFKQNQDVDLIYGDVDQGWEIANSMKRKGKQQNHNVMLKSCVIKIPQMSALWKKKVYTDVGELKTDLNVLLDWEYFLRISKNKKIKYIEGTVAFFRQHAGSKSIQLNTQWAREIENYYVNYFSNKSETKLFSSICLVNMYFYCAGLFLEENNLIEAKKYYEKAKRTSAHVYIFKKIERFVIKTLIKIKRMFNGKN
jgi:glycosyltransferase involved in cell wall biosynthesis